MTVADLISLLQKMDPTLPLMVVVDGAHLPLIDAEENGDVGDHSRVLLTIEE